MQNTLDDVIDSLPLLTDAGAMARTETAYAVRRVLRAALDADRARIARGRDADAENALHASLASLAAATQASFGSDAPPAATPMPPPDPDDIVGTMWASGKQDINAGLLGALAAGRTYGEVRAFLIAALDACWATGGASALGEGSAR